MNEAGPARSGRKVKLMADRQEQELKRESYEYKSEEDIAGCVTRAKAGVGSEAWARAGPGAARFSIF